MPRYAQGTDVSSDRSLAEIQGTLRRYGASGFGYAWEGARAMIQFTMQGRRIRFEVPLPDQSEFALTPAGKRRRSQADQMKAWEQATRQRWRALALAVKAKLEVVESGIATFEEEFLAYVVLPSGDTVGRLLGPQIELAYNTGRMPPLLLGPGDAEGELVS